MIVDQLSSPLLALTPSRSLVANSAFRSDFAPRSLNENIYEKSIVGQIFMTENI